MDDSSLLQAFARQGDESAFAELVRRHMPFVYSVAYRRVSGDVHLAKDIAQDVFVAMGRKAKSLSSHPALKAWLYTSARYTAANRVQTYRRRRAREMAQSMNEINQPEPSDPAWVHLRPLLDEALDRLNERDRTAVILRFFEDRSFGEIGRAQGLSEDGARLRVNRALEKLAVVIGKRGVTSTAAMLALGLGNETMAAMAPGLVEATTRSALSALHPAVPAIGSSTGLFKVTASIKGGAGIAAIVFLLAAGGWWGWRLVTNRGRELLALQQQVDRDRHELETLSHRRSALQTDALRAKQASVEVDTLTRRVKALRDWFAQNPALALPDFHVLKDRDWIALAYEHPEIDAGGDLWPVAQVLRANAIELAMKTVQEALGAYIAASPDRPLTDPSQLLPYAPSLDAASLMRYTAFPDVRTIKNLGSKFRTPALVSHPEVRNLPRGDDRTGDEIWWIITSYARYDRSRLIGDTRNPWP